MMTSSCNSDIMHFQAGPCEPNEQISEIYEKRVYRCLGQWTDKTNNSTVYTFTKRVDESVNAFECFVGLMTDTEKQIVIREAGENCFKSLDPKNYGMDMHQIGKWSLKLMTFIISNTYHYRALSER